MFKKFTEWLIEHQFYQKQKFSDPLEVLIKIKSSHHHPESLVCTFTEINKVGINPVNKHNTPTGIYLYPLDYVISVRMDVPFAKNARYVNVCEFTRPNKILHMLPVEDDLSRPLEERKSKQKNYEKLPPQVIDEILKNYTFHSDHELLWLGAKRIAKNTTDWAAVFRRMGIDGFVDHGTKTIWDNEPTQCVIFQQNGIRQIHTIERFRKTDRQLMAKYKSQNTITQYDDDDIPPLPEE